MPTVSVWMPNRGGHKWSWDTLLRRVGGTLMRGAHDIYRAWRRWRERDRPGPELWQEPRCQHCGGWHDGVDLGVCPRVRRLVYHLDAAGNRRLQEVEYWAWREWPHKLVTWPSQVPLINQPAQEERVAA